MNSTSFMVDFDHVADKCQKFVIINNSAQGSGKRTFDSEIVDENKKVDKDTAQSFICERLEASVYWLRHRVFGTN